MTEEMSVYCQILALQENIDCKTVKLKIMSVDSDTAYWSKGWTLKEFTEYKFGMLWEKWRKEFIECKRRERSVMTSVQHPISSDDEMIPEPWIEQKKDL